MQLGLKGKKALITGASYGLGYACADALAGEGVDVVICSRDKEKLARAAEGLSSRHGVKSIGVAADLTKKEDLERLVVESEKILGQVDILVVSTGHPPTMPFSKATDKDWENGASLVLRPPLVLSKLLLDGMRARKFGRIILIGSIFGLEAEQSSVVQSTFRTGLNAMAKCIASETAADGVTVNVICPGYFDTPLVRELAKQYAHTQSTTVEKVLDSWKEFAPVKRFGKPEDLGALVAFMASPRAEFMTGTAVTIDGGAIRQY
jgi:3-oxoacyl-[acyl-carrier protein] reductase